MSSERGLKIARERIAREFTEKTGFVDLGNLGLTELPAELFSLIHLHELNLGGTYIDQTGKSQWVSSDLGQNEIQDVIVHLAALTALRSLFLNSMKLSDLASIEGLRTLQSVHFSSTLVSDVGPLAHLPHLQTLDCSKTEVNDLTPLAHLANLETLDCSGTQVSDLSPLRSVPNLRTLNCSSTPVVSLAPLAGLVGFQVLYCSHSKVSDLSPLARVPNLQKLDCSSTPVSDLSPLAGLANLQTLNFRSTDVTLLRPITSLSALEVLDCSETKLHTILEVESFKRLRRLICYGLNINDISSLNKLEELRELNLNGTQVSDLAPIQGCTKLRALVLSGSQVKDISPLENLSELQILFLMDTKVDDLTPLSNLPQLKTLNMSQGKLRATFEDIWLKPSLERLSLYNTYVPGVPAEVLAQSDFDNCLDKLRSHLRDLVDGAEELPDVKLMVLGNGRVGKTQLCRRLRDEPYDERIESTHGIIVTSAPLRYSDSARIRLQVWDFGGQDIYHGTHALFMRSRAIFMLVWFPEAELTPEHRHGGFVFRNQPLAYWLEYIGHFGGANSPVAIVQTRCDKTDDERIAPISNEKLGAFRPLPKVVHYSALNDRGRRSLEDALAQCVESLREREGGVALIGVGRAKVKRRIETLRDADAMRPPLERANRTLGYDEYLDFCAEAGGVSDPTQLLDYLHNVGTVFYRKGLFENRIIIDQSWALESIYALFNRVKCYSKIIKQNGRFTRSDLGEWVWNEAGHGAKEQELLLSMMESCGICFRHRPASPDGKFETEYIAPDLLPERPDAEIEQKWDGDRSPEKALLTYPLLPQTLVRGVIARIGSEAGLAADYWRDGVYVYEATTGSRGLVEQRTTGPWQGEIIVQTQRGQALRLLERLLNLIAEEQQRIGVEPANKAGFPPRLSAEEGIQASDEKGEAPPALKFAQEPVGPELFVSYAWGDETPEGRRREEIVDRLCAAAEKRGITILRDKKTMGLGDSIAKFMNRLAQGHRIFVVLSDKYLKSAYCMYELMEVWRYCFQEERRFLDRIRIITLPDAKIFSIPDRLKFADYWHEKRVKIEGAIKAYDITRLGTHDFNELKMMQKFSNEVGDILYAIADKVQPRAYEEFEKYALEDLIGAGGNGKA